MLETETTPEPSRIAWRGWATGFLVLGGLLWGASLVDLPYYAFAPGPIKQVDPLIRVDGADRFDSAGTFYILTITREEVSLIGFLVAEFDDEIDLVSKEAVRPPDVSPDEQRRIDLGQMEDAKAVATAVALDRLGYEVGIIGEGVAVRRVDDGPALAILEPSDVITAVDGEPVKVVEDLLAALGRRSPGDRVRLQVDRQGTVIELSAVLDPPAAAGGRPRLGIEVATYKLRFDLPVDVEIESEAIAGPSGGLMFTLGIMDALNAEDLTHGKEIAGTGEIRLDGSVGAIGGVHQKVLAARAAGADVVLVPDENLAEAQSAAHDEIEVVAVSNIDEALDFLSTLS